jgi:hypothetical protein
MTGVAQALLEGRTGIEVEVAAWPGEVADKEPPARPASKMKEAWDLDGEHGSTSTLY